MKSFRTSLAVRMGLGVLALLIATGGISLLALRSILYRQWHLKVRVDDDLAKSLAMPSTSLLLY